MPSTSVAGAKLSPPSLARHTFKRPQLLPSEALAKVLVLTALVAPAGYGKSTAAQQIAESLSTEYCWLSLEPAENDPARFIAYISAALLPEDAAQSIAATAADEPDGVALAFDLLRSELDQFVQRTVLVLDNFHEIEDRAILDAVTSWLLVPPTHLVLICTGRSELRLPLAKLRSQGRLHSLGIAELAFDLGETQTLLDDLPSQADVDHVQTAAEVMSITEGWPALVSLSGQAKQQGSATTNRFNRFLRTEVEPSLSTAQHAFLTATSVAGILSPDLCNVLTEGKDALEMLQELARSRMVTLSVADPAQPRTEASYRMHPVLRDRLCDALAQEDPDRFRSLYTRAATWYNKNGQLRSAIRCATVGRDVGLGQQLILGRWRVAVRPINFDVVREWATTVGPDGTDDDRICMILARGSLKQRREADMHYWLARAEALSLNRTTELSMAVSRQIILAYWNHDTGRIETMNEHASAAVSLLGPLRIDEFSNPEMKVFYNAAKCLQGMAAVLLGDVDTGQALLVESCAFARHEGNLATLIRSLSHLALVEAWAGNAHSALMYADEALQRTDRTPDDRRLTPVYSLALSIAHLVLGDDEAAALDAAAALAKMPAAHPVHRGLIHLQQARIEHRQGSLDAARQSLGQAREFARASSPSVLDAHVRSVENELRFLGLGSNEQLPPGARDLTSRELEILGQLSGPMSRREIAAHLHISENTVKTHLTAISRKLEVRGRADIVSRAAELELIDTPPVPPTR